MKKNFYDLLYILNMIHVGRVKFTYPQVSHHFTINFETDSLVLFLPMTFSGLERMTILSDMSISYSATSSFVQRV